MAINGSLALGGVSGGQRPSLQRNWIPTDLAPGDQRAVRLAVAGLVLRAVGSVEDPAFPRAYAFLAAKFDGSGALESVDVLAQRFAWPRAAQADGWTLLYEMLSITDADGNLAAVRDHTAAMAPVAATGKPQLFVHLSHVLAAEKWRRSGLGGWLRALPLQTARNCLRLGGCPSTADITLVAEMEASDSDSSEQAVSLLAYEKAGFRKLDPDRVSYVQPDFRSAAEIDRTGGPRPLPFSLVVRQVGREDEGEMSGAQVRLLARALYRVYRDGCRSTDLAPLLSRIEQDYPPPQDRIRLVPPSVNAAPV